MKVNFLEYYSVVTAVSSVKHISACSQMQNTKSLLGSKDFCKLAYTLFIERHVSPPQRSQSKWISDFQIYDVDKIDWCQSYSLPFLCTREPKLRIFQFKLLHRRISTNRYLFKIGISSSELCSFCENSSETLLHLFWECPQVKIFWNEVKTWLCNYSCFCVCCKNKKKIILN